MSLVTTNALDGTLAKTIECPVCIQVFEDPKTLQCGHSLCSACARELQRGPHTADSDLGGISFDLPPTGIGSFLIRCPVCRQMSEVPENGVISRLRELQEKTVECSSCGQKTGFGFQLICESCVNVADDMNVFCVPCAISQHANHGHQVVPKSAVFAHIQQETLAKIRSIAEESERTVNNTIKAAFSTASVLTDLELLTRELQHFGEAIAKLEKLQFCTKELSVNTITKLEQLSSSLTKVSAKYEGILSEACSKVQSLRQEAVQVFNGTNNANSLVGSCSPEDTSSLGDLRISSLEETRLLNLSPSLFNYPGCSSCRESKIRRRAALIARRRSGATYQRTPSPENCSE